MFPAYGYNHAYPQMRPQMCTECCHHPTSEGIHPQMKIETPSHPPFMYESWAPHHYGHPVPTQCHSCCNHNNLYPSYYPYRPPYPHFPSPPQCYEAYSVYPEPFPFHYAPPPHYTMEIPKYDKSMPGNFHCCGCSHPKGNMNGDKGVKIEEHESKATKQEDPLVPTGFKNLQNKPIMWVPPEYLKNQERVSGTKPREPNAWPALDLETIKRILESGEGRKLQDQKNMRLIKSREREDDDHKERLSRENLNCVGQKPKTWSGLMPMDVDSLKKVLQQHENSRKDHGDQVKIQNQELPFPMIWLPYKNEENEKGTSSASESSTQQMIPATEAEGNEGGKLSVEKSEKPPRTIPVKYMDETTDMKAKSIEDDKKSTEKAIKSKPSSPGKATKLPPICLRVDPLPKKKTSQGKSRSPSPPGDKANHVEAVKPSSISENKAKGIENEPDKKSREAPQLKTEVDTAEVEKPSKLAGDKSEGKDVREKPKSKDVELKKRILSGTEAATIIQSAYRGYEVRRWEPLKKMRQIATIKEEADALKRLIESGAVSMDLKQKVALGETIMSLLLKLDTIQGLHSSVRDARKSVAKQLVNLQEMLDTIVLKQPENKSSQKPDIGETEAKAGETQLQTGDEPSLSSGLSTAEEHGAVETEEETKDQENAVPEKETEQNDLVAVKKAEIKNLDEAPGESSSVEKTSIESTDQEPALVLSEVGANSTDMNHDFLAELPAAVPENSEPPAIDPESNEASKAEVLTEKDAESPEESKCEVSIEDSAPSCEVNDQTEAVQEENVKKLESERRVKEENERMKGLLEKLIASEKEQLEVICSLNKKLKDLEGKLAKEKQKKKKGSRARKARVLMHSPCRTTSSGVSKEGVQMRLRS